MLATAMTLGLSACLGTGGSKDALCDELEAPVRALSDALVANPDTAAEVGIPGAQTVIIAQGGCG